MCFSVSIFKLYLSFDLIRSLLSCGILFSSITTHPLSLLIEKRGVCFRKLKKYEMRKKHKSFNRKMNAILSLNSGCMEVIKMGLVHIAS